MEKTLRVLGGDDEDAASHSHSHPHSHSPVEVAVKASGVSSTTSEGNRPRSRKTKSKRSSPEHKEEHKPSTSPSKLSAYLNLFGDFVHNMYIHFHLLYHLFNMSQHTEQMALRTSLPMPCLTTCLLTLSRMAASFYSSPLIGATTTLACFAHEIPHEIADYSILIRSGFTKKQAMQSQFLTAIVRLLIY